MSLFSSYLIQSEKKFFNYLLFLIKKNENICTDANEATKYESDYYRMVVAVNEKLVCLALVCNFSQ